MATFQNFDSANQQNAPQTQTQGSDVPLSNPFERMQQEGIQPSEAAKAWGGQEAGSLNEAPPVGMNNPPAGSGPRPDLSILGEHGTRAVGMHLLGNAAKAGGFCA